MCDESDTVEIPLLEWVNIYYIYTHRKFSIKYHRMDCLLTSWLSIRIVMSSYYKTRTHKMGFAMEYNWSLEGLWKILLMLRLSMDNMLESGSSYQGYQCYYQKISLSSLQLKRKKFRIQLSFTMTINKAQGQTIPHVGIYLLEPVFAHRQLYVALSRGV
jgi:ATP-dependent DNA helicase PIF1